MPIVGLVGIGCWGICNQQLENIAFAEPAVGVRQMLQFPDPESEMTFPEILKMPKGEWKKVSATNYRYVGGSAWAYVNLHSNFRVIFRVMTGPYTKE